MTLSTPPCDHKQHSGFRNFGSRVNAWMTEIMLGKPRN